MKNVYFSVLFATLLVFTACDKNEHLDCDKQAIVDNELYENGPNDHINIISAKMNANCLEIEFGASGCDGSSWKIELYDSGNIAESWPEQRYIRLSLLNRELCDAYFEREQSFDVSGLKVNGKRVILNLQNWNEQIIYEY